MSNDLSLSRRKGRGLERIQRGIEIIRGVKGEGEEREVVAKHKRERIPSEIHGMALKMGRKKGRAVEGGTPGQENGRLEEKTLREGRK